MGICRSPTYWCWSMSTTISKETCTDQTFCKEEELQFHEKGILKKTCSACVCMTWQHFHCSSDKHCRTLLSCYVHRRLLPRGDHLISRCHLWKLQRERETGWCPEVAWHLELINLSIWFLIPSFICVWGRRALSLFLFLFFISSTLYGFIVKVELF